MSKTAFDTFDTGLPLGNLTSQLLVNIYMNEFDQFVKHKLKVKHPPERVGAHSVRAGYIRYADDFVILSNNHEYLTHIRYRVNAYLEKNLKLSLHPDKVFIKTLSSGVDFLGWVYFPTHRVLRTVTKRRMLKNLNTENKSSYLGMLRYGNTYKLRLALRQLSEEE